jgi:hypothetical protein
MDGIAKLHAWQWFFLIEGAASIVVAIVAFFVSLSPLMLGSGCSTNFL